MKKIILLIALTLTFSINSQTLQWAKSAGGSENDHARAMVIDSENNVYTSGHFSGTSDFDPNAGTATLSSQGEKDVYLQKLDENGNFQWAISFGGPEVDQANTLHADGNDNIYVLGTFRNTVDFDPSTAVFELTAIAEFDGFVAKFDSDGNFLWAIQTGSAGENSAWVMTSTSENDLIVAGYFSDTTDFDPGTTTVERTPTGGSDMFVLKLTEDAEFVWVKQFGGTTQDDSLGARAMAINSQQDIIVGGYLSGTVDFDPSGSVEELTSNGLGDFFLVSLSESGDYNWANSFGSTTGFEMINGLVLDSENNIFVAGHFSGTMDIDPNANNTILEAPESLDNGFLIKYNSNGALIWGQSYGENSFARVYGLTLDDNENPIALFKYEGTVDFDLGPDEKLLVSNGNWDVAVLLLDPNGTYQWAGSMGGTDVDLGLSIASDNENNIVLNGYFYGTSDYDPSEDEFLLTSSGGRDIFVVKLKNPLLSTPENNFLDKISAYPNPTKGSFTLSFRDIPLKATVQIVNSVGQTVLHKEFQGQKDIMLTLPSASGVYFCKVVTPSGYKTFKILKD